MTHNGSEGLSSLAALPSLERRIVLLELEAHPAPVEAEPLARLLGIVPEELHAAREEAWRKLGPRSRARLAEAARAEALLIPLDAAGAARFEAGEGPFAPLPEDDVLATARRCVTHAYR